MHYFPLLSSIILGCKEFDGSWFMICSFHILGLAQDWCGWRCYRACLPLGHFGWRCHYLWGDICYEERYEGKDHPIAGKAWEVDNGCQPNPWRPFLGSGEFSSHILCTQFLCDSYFNWAYLYQLRSMVQIETHYALQSLVPEMLLDKLQLIATSSTNAAMKVQWLIWWNSSTSIWVARKFLEALVGEDKLTLWLAKACWYVWMRAHLICCCINILYLFETLSSLSKCCIFFV
jgi:hypothetical protein